MVKKQLIEQLRDHYLYCIVELSEWTDTPLSYYHLFAKQMYIDEGVCACAIMRFDAKTPTNIWYLHPQTHRSSVNKHLYWCKTPKECETAQELVQSLNIRLEILNANL